MTALSAQTSTADAVALARKGEYGPAAVALDRAVGAGTLTPAVVEGLYYSWIRQGEYVKARDRFEALAKSSPNAAPVRLAAARANRVKPETLLRRLAHLNAIQDNAEIGLAARNEKAEVLIDTGKREEADVIYKKTIDDYQKGRLNRKQDQIFVARALWAIGNFYDANETFKLIERPILKMPKPWSPGAICFPTAPNEAEAVLSYEDALKVDPNMPEALLGMARNLPRIRKMPRRISSGLSR